MTTKAKQTPMFLDHLEVEMVGDADRGKWRLKSALRYQSREDGLWIVPAGFRTDFASVPRLPITFALTGDTAHRPATLHDWLYSRADVERALCDKLFREAMATIGVPTWRRWLMWAGVRVFGWMFKR